MRAPESRFPFDHMALMSDPGFESRVSMYLLRLEFVTARANDILGQQGELRELIDSVVLR